jgi:hypothetical protein
MNLYEYIAVNNSLGANELLKNYGLKPTRSVKEIISRLKVIVRKYKKDALQDISTIHPDRSLLNFINHLCLRSVKSPFADVEQDLPIAC